MTHFLRAKRSFFAVESMARAKGHYIPGYIWHITNHAINESSFSNSQRIGAGTYNGCIRPGSAAVYPF